jgi:hypothetical protein
LQRGEARAQLGSNRLLKKHEILASPWATSVFQHPAKPDGMMFAVARKRPRLLELELMLACQRKANWEYGSVRLGDAYPG